MFTAHYNKHNIQIVFVKFMYQSLTNTDQYSVSTSSNCARENKMNHPIKKASSHTEFNFFSEIYANFVPIYSSITMLVALFKIISLETLCHKLYNAYEINV